MTAPTAAFFSPANAAGFVVAGRVSGEMMFGIVVRSAVSCDGYEQVASLRRVERGYLVGEGF